MHRSASWTRNTDDYFVNSPPRASTLLRMMSSEPNELPAYDPIVEMARKEKQHSKFAENAVHFIPLVLLVCGFILWFFSNPDVEVGGKLGDSITSRIEGLTIEGDIFTKKKIEGDIDTDSDGTQTGFLPIDVGDLTNSNRSKINKRFRKLLDIF